jgi:hypothetical protein
MVIATKFISVYIVIGLSEKRIAFLMAQSGNRKQFLVETAGCAI